MTDTLLWETRNDLSTECSSNQISYGVTAGNVFVMTPERVIV